MKLQAISRLKEVAGRKQVTPEMLAAAQKEVGAKAGGYPVTVIINPDDDYQLVAKVDLGDFYGKGQSPWVEAWDAPKAINKMIGLGYKLGSISSTKKKCTLDFYK